MSDIKVGDKVKSLVNYFDIAEGDTLTVAKVDNQQSGLIEVQEYYSGNTLLGSEYKKIEEVPSRPTIEQLLSKANKHSAKAAKHEKKCQELIEQAKELLPDGWVLSETGEVVEESVEEDMSDTDNWRAWDIVEFTGEAEWMTTGNNYELMEWRLGGVLDEGDNVKIQDNDGDVRIALHSSEFKWISRPSKETK